MPYKDPEMRKMYAKRHARYYLEALFVYALDVVCGSMKHQCAHCGGSDLRYLQFDHINGEGTKERSKGYAPFYTNTWIIKNVEDARTKLQVLCANCNIRKRWNDAECYKYK